MLCVTATPAQAITWKEFWEPFNNGSSHYHYRPSYPRYYWGPYDDEICKKTTYREEYIPGNIHRPGYVQRHRETYRVPCD